MQDVLARAKKIKLLILDIDGVCTDGKLYFNEQGETLKVFHVHDGLGMKLLQKSGVIIAVISARNSAAVNYRLQSLGITQVYQGQENKLIAFEKILQELQLTEDDVAYLGDDLPDLPIIRRVGLGMCVANANQHVKQHAHHITTQSGGNGAVREVCELIMQAQNTWQIALQNYF